MNEAQPQRRSRQRSVPSLSLLAGIALLLGVVSPSIGAQAPATGAGAAMTTGGAATPSAASAPLGASVPGGGVAGARTAASTGAEGQRTATEEARRTVVPTPDRLTDFQQMVVQTTGRSLPVFGANLFENVPSTFAPVDNAPVAPNYVVGPGDELRVQIFGQLNQQNTFVVDRAGSISLPQVGPVHVAGLEFAQVQPFLKSELAKVYRNFDLSVEMGRLSSIQVFVVGQARRPGSYTIGSMSTLLNALFASGGPLPQGSLRDIQVQRSGKTVVHFDLYDLLLHGDKRKDVSLAAGDVIFIPVTGAQTAVLGSVSDPAIYEVLPGTTVRQVIELAGGLTNVAASGQVRLERIFEHTMRSVVDVNLAQGQDPVIENGDILSLPAVMDRFRETVTLRGNVANPGRYLWHPGMRISDLIPSRDALVTRDYFRRRNTLGQTGVDYLPESQAPAAGQGALQVRGPGDNAAPASTQASGNQGGSSVGTALTGNSGVFQARTDVVLSAPDINWSYAVIERQSAADLTTSLIPFHLGKVILDGNAAENKDLLAGDVVTIFSTADIRVPTTQQTRFVRLEGEFLASGVYSVEPGETLRHLLRRAGGFTPDAYLYASEFTRESTRRVERQRLNEYADTLEAQVDSSASTANARAISDRDAASATASLQNARQAIARLRQMEPIGRIVLSVKPESRDIDSIPDLALEDGDRFVVPRVPSVVNVEGRVYSSNAFVYQTSRRTLDYLREAGGPDREADRKRMFVLRADGSVFSRQYGNVEHATIYPGDTVVVPPQLEKRAVLRDLLDISTIVGQFGLGAAAVNVLR